MSERNLRDVATGLRFPEGPIALADGSFLVVEIEAGRVSRVSADGVVTTLADTGGGPNGAALGPDGRVYVCNNGGMAFHHSDGLILPGHGEEDAATGWVDAIDLETGAVETLYRDCDARPLIAPNDLVFDAAGGFYFTDHGKARKYDRGPGRCLLRSRRWRPHQPCLGTDGRAERHWPVSRWQDALCGGNADGAALGV